MSTRTTRRDVLKSAGLAAGALLAKDLLGAATRSDSFTVALISDTHLGRDGEGPSGQFSTAVAEINATDARFTLCCGDLVNAGQEPANERRYPEWVQTASRLKQPWHAVPGNHDPDALFMKHIAPRLDFTVDCAPFRFICFRDAQPNPGHMGVVTLDQVKWISDQLDQARRDGRRALLFAHVVHHENQKPDHGWMISSGRKEFTEMMTAHEKTIAAFIAGHHHVGLRGWSDSTVHEVMLPSNCWNFETDLSGAGGYSYPERRPGYVLAQLSADRITLAYKPLGQPVSVTKELAI
jgi:3',5'-cyclic AMP phosphodiesterase CpdA